MAHRQFINNNTIHPFNSL